MRYAIKTESGRELRVYAPTLRQAILAVKNFGEKPLRPLSQHKALALEDEPTKLQEGPTAAEKKKMGKR